MKYDPDKYITRLGGKLNYAGIDLDGTLAEEVWETSTGIGKPIQKNINKLRPLIEAGYKIVIYTARPWSEVENIKRWCRTHGVPAHQIICGKPLFAFVVDDKSVNSRDRNWTPKWFNGNVK